MNTKRFIFFLLGFVLYCAILSSQNVGIKTNFIYWGTTTPNAGLEFALNRKYTLEVAGGYNPFTLSDTKKLKNWLVQPELRYWLCESFNGHFFGLHALAAEYNVGGINVPVGRLKNLKDYRYEGFAYGAGLSYGYQWYLGKAWNLELNIGAGYAYMPYDKYPCIKCGSKIESGTYNYFGVTKAAVSLIYFIK